MTAIVPFEPIPLPDLHRLDTTLHLPGWLASRLASSAMVHQADDDGRHRRMATLPSELLPTATQRAAIEDHVAALQRMLDQTPLNDDASMKATLVVITKLLLALPSQKATEAAAEARGEAYMAALEDLPCWAVASAARRWYRGECGPEHDCRWQPAPAVLREVARVEEWKIVGRVHALKGVLDAKPLITFSEEHCAVMRQRLAAEIFRTPNGSKRR
jgi:hypothetical protein